jgi:FAD/FMN-containing dehydrogenase
MSTYAQRRAALLDSLAGGAVSAGLAKRTSSNLFRYGAWHRPRGQLDLSAFDHCLAVDRQAGTLEVEGLATFERIVDTTLPHGLIPPVTPELKHITIGGAIVGIGIESNGFRHGFVHDALLEADVMLPDGRVVLATADNEHAMLFRALPNSYGTLGYILRAKIRLIPAVPYVHLRTTPVDSVERFLADLQAATERDDVDFVEGLFFDERRLYVMVSRFARQVSHVDDILRQHVFYRLVQARPDVYLDTKSYLFRYDPEWFWNLPESLPYRLFRRYAPENLRNSGFYKRYTARKHAWRARLGLRSGDHSMEPLIQDWEVPWDQAAPFIRFALREVDLAGRPWIVTPIRTRRAPTLYPVAPNRLYCNLGCYCHVRRAEGREDFWHTKVMDSECFARGGIKMLYSSTFLPQQEFERIYNGRGYAEAKARYDPQRRAPALYDKVVYRPQ